MISLAVAANAAFGVVVEANKVDEKPNMEYIDESWGEPVAANITSATENTWLWDYWNEVTDQGYGYMERGAKGRDICFPEDNPIDLYIVWDNKYLYVAFDVVDYSISGNADRHRGDGIHLWVEPAEVVKDPTFGVEDNGDDDDYFTNYGYPLDYRQYIWTFDPSDWDCHAEGAAEACEYYINPELEDRWHAMIAIPWLNLNVGKANLVDGFEVAITFMRVSSRMDYEAGTGLDEGYSGGLCWGRYFMETNLWGKPGNYSLNTLILRDPETAGQYTPETEAPETDAPETDAPETEAPETEAPETDAPETDAPETDAPETDAPETDAPETDAPETDAPETDAPETDAPETDAPETDAPETDAPETDAPETDAPETDAPETEAPETDAPKTDAPATDAPETDAPTAPAEPAKKGNTGLIIGIVAAVVVVGAVIGIVLGKKKK